MKEWDITIDFDEKYIEKVLKDKKCLGFEIWKFETGVLTHEEKLDLKEQ